MSKDNQGGRHGAKFRCLSFFASKANHRRQARRPSDRPTRPRFRIIALGMGSRGPVPRTRSNWAKHYGLDLGKHSGLFESLVRGHRVMSTPADLTTPRSDLLAALQAIFPSYSEAYGQFERWKVRNGPSKIPGKYRTVNAPHTDAVWLAHLAGERESLGVCPLLDDGYNVGFGAIDIDDHTINLPELEKRVQELELPLLTCRSKSGGAHLYLFLIEPLPATNVVQALKIWAGDVGYPDAEIFPKQTQRSIDENGNPRPGNWINLVYFDAAHPTQYCIHNGKATSLEAFVDLAEDSRVTADELKPRASVDVDPHRLPTTPKANTR